MAARTYLIWIFLLPCKLKSLQSGTQGIKTIKKLCTGDGAGAVIPAGSKLGSGAGAEKAQNSWARLFFQKYISKIQFSNKLNVSPKRQFIIWPLSADVGSSKWTFLTDKWTEGRRKVKDNKIVACFIRYLIYKSTERSSYTNTLFHSCVLFSWKIIKIKVPTKREY